jgi:hypothetical protein
MNGATLSAASVPYAKRSGDAPLLDERVGHAGRVGRPEDEQRREPDHHDAKADRDAGRNRRSGDSRRADLDQGRQRPIAVGAREQDREGGQAQDGEAERGEPTGDAAQRQARPEPQCDDRGQGQPDGHDRVDSHDAGDEPRRAGNEAGNRRGPGQEGRPGRREGRR